MIKWWKTKRFITLITISSLVGGACISIAAAYNHQYKIKPILQEQLHQNASKQSFIALKLNSSNLNDKNKAKLANMIVRLVVSDEKKMPIKQAQSVINIYDPKNDVLFVGIDKGLLKANYIVNIVFEKIIASMSFVVSEKFLSNKIIENVPSKNIQ